MSSKNSYGGIIWTNHALERLTQRGFTQEMAWQTFKTADTRAGAKEGSTEFRKKFGSSTVSVVAKQNEKREWIVISAWVYPPIEGTEDYRKHIEYKEYKKSSGLKKFFLALKKHLGF
jgi:hypothetical protein